MQNCLIKPSQSPPE